MKPESKFIRISQVSEIVGIGKSTVWKWIKTKQFPSPTKLSPKVSVWRLDEVINWVDTQSSNTTKGVQYAF